MARTARPHPAVVPSSQIRLPLDPYQQFSLLTSFPEDHLALRSDHTHTDLCDPPVQFIAEATSWANDFNHVILLRFLANGVNRSTHHFFRSTANFSSRTTRCEWFSNSVS